MSAGDAYWGCLDGTSGAGAVRGTESSIRGSIVWITSSIRLSLFSAVAEITGGGVTGTCGRTGKGCCWGTVPLSVGMPAVSVSFTIGVPHRLQNTDSGGTRLPHRLQNEPVGREVVSIGTGIAGAASTIFFIGRATSIRLFGGWVASIRWGAGTVGCTAGAGSVGGGTGDTGW